MLPQRFARFNIYYRRQQGNRLQKIQPNIHLFALLQCWKDIFNNLKEVFQSLTELLAAKNRLKTSFYFKIMFVCYSIVGYNIVREKEFLNNLHTL